MPISNRGILGLGLMWGGLGAAFGLVGNAFYTQENSLELSASDLSNRNLWSALIGAGISFISVVGISIFQNWRSNQSYQLVNSESPSPPPELSLDVFSPAPSSSSNSPRNVSRVSNSSQSAQPPASPAKVNIVAPRPVRPTGLFTPPSINCRTNNEVTPNRSNTAFEKRPRRYIRPY